MTSQGKSQSPRLPEFRVIPRNSIEHLNQWTSGSNRLLPAAKSLQSCPTLCDPIDGSPPGSTVPGILQARTLEWVAISFSNAWKCKVKVKSLSCVWLLATPWTTAYQAPSSMGFSGQQYWSGVPLPSPSNRLRTPKWKDTSCYSQTMEFGPPNTSQRKLKNARILRL